MDIPIPFILSYKLKSWNESSNLEGYKMYFITFLVLSVLTLVSVGITQIRIAPPAAIGIILLIAAIQAAIVLFYNMHLKFNEKILGIFVGLVFSMILFLIIVTMMDFSNR